MQAAKIETLKRFDASQGPRKLGPQEGKAVDVAGLGVRFRFFGEQSHGGFALVEHGIPPRTLAGPVHRHSREDEYSYVLARPAGLSTFSSRPRQRCKRPTSRPRS